MASLGSLEGFWSVCVDTDLVDLTSVWLETREELCMCCHFT